MICMYEYSGGLDLRNFVVVLKYLMSLGPWIQKIHPIFEASADCINIANF